MTTRLALLDYELSNLLSARKAFERLGAEVTITRGPDELGEPDAVVLPGVGNFGEAMRRVRALGLDEAIAAAPARGLPVLGICLGLQLLFEGSEEAPGVDGLGLIPGRVRRLRSTRKLPQIGWNEVSWRDGPLAARPGSDPGASIYYFVHAYAVEPDDERAVLATADYGTSFCAAAGFGRVMGVQFHPEKSSSAGLALLDRWLAWVRRGAAVPA